MNRRFPRRTAVGGLLPAALLALLAAVGPASAGDRYELDTGREAALVGAGVGIGLSAMMVARGEDLLSAADLVDRDRRQIAGFDRLATRRWSPGADTASDVLAYGLMASPALLYTQTGSGLDAGELTVMWGETLLLQQATVGLLKGVFGRARPFVYNDDPRIPAELKRSRTAVRSFPSGHTATAFAGAVFLGEVFARLNPADPARHWVRGGSLALAAATGWLRIAAGKHFPTDVIAGALVGSLIGWGVPRLHEVGGDGGGAAKAGPALGLVFGCGF